jgi:hypothetical protein
MTNMTRVLFNAEVPASIALLLFVVSLWRGAAPERFLSASLLMAACCKLSCRAMLPLGAEWEHSGMDAIMFMAIAMVALHANRLYPVWIGAAQIVKLVSHALRLSFDKPPALAYLVIDQAAFDLQLLIMAIGLACHVERRRRSYPAWVR